MIRRPLNRLGRWLCSLTMSEQDAWSAYAGALGDAATARYEQRQRIDRTNRALARAHNRTWRYRIAWLSARRRAANLTQLVNALEAELAGRMDDHRRARTTTPTALGMADYSRNGTMA